MRRRNSGRKLPPLRSLPFSPAQSRCCFYSSRRRHTRLQGDWSSRRVLFRSQAEALLSQARASLQPLRIDLEAQMNRLDVLLGVQPGTSAAELQTPSDIPSVPSVPDNDTPLDVLRRRPDVIAAERHLAASNARIGQALANYYPNISLAGVLGYESSRPSDLFKAATFQPQGIAGLRWRGFDFGKVTLEVAQARGANAEALARDQQAVLRAGENVEKAFT